MSIKQKSIEYKKIMGKKDGVTFMILVITIILIMILSNAIIVLLNISNPIGESVEARVRSDIQSMKDNYDIIYNDLLFENSGNKQKIKDDDFKDVVPEKYKDDFVANKDGIDYIGDDEDIKKIVDEMEIGQKDKKIPVDIAAVGKVTSVELEAIINKYDPNIDEYIFYIKELGDTEWKEYRSPDPKIEIDGLKEKTIYEVKVEVIKDGKPEESEIKEVTTKELEVGKLVMKINDRNGENYVEGTWTKENVYVEVEGDNTTYTATGATTIDKTSEPSTLTNQGITNVVLETKDGESVITKEYKVLIDKESPEGKLEKQIIPKGSLNGDVVVTIKDPIDNLSGVKEYEYYINGEPRAVSKNNKYTYENLEKGEYEIKVVIVDRANNKRELETQKVAVGIPNANDESKIQVKKEPTKWTNSNVTLTVTFTAEGMYIPQYSEDKVTWTDVDRTYVKEIEKNKSVYVRYRYSDILDYGGVPREIIIDNIDKDLPEIISLESSNTNPTNQNITLTAKAKDTLSGIVAFQFSKDGSLTATSGGWETIPNTREEITKEYIATESTTYYFYVKDEAGNVSKKEIKTENIDKEIPTISIETNGGTYVIPVGSTEINITTKLEANDTGTSKLDILQYQLSEKTEVPSDDDENWKNFTNGEEVTESRGGGTYYLYTKVIDGAGNRAEEIKKSAPYIVKYQVKYDANEGTGAPEEQAKTHDEELTLSEEEPTRRGYTFKGWSADKNATEPEYAAGGEYNENSPVLLYAVWEINKYKVTYNYSENGGTSVTKTTDTVTYMQQVDLTPTAIKEGSEFVGWNTDKEATEILTSFTMDAEDVVLYAIYKRPIKGIFNYYDGTQATSKEVVGYAFNKSTTASIATPTIENVVKDGVTYTPRGWSTANTANATIEVVGGENITLNADTTYYASYTQTITATFYYNANKTATSSVERFMNYTGEHTQNNITVPAVVTSTAGPASTTYSHVATTKTGGAVTPTTDTLTYYAVYKKTVTATKYVYNNSASTVAGTAWGYYDGTTANASIALGTTSLSGYTFRGWSTSNAANANITIVANGTASILNNTTYYASYTQTITATFYYYANKTATSSATRYMNYVGSYIHANISIPAAVSSSTGPASTKYHHVATTKTGGVVTPTTATATYYAVYTKTVTATKYVYNNSASTATGTAYGYYDGTTTNASINLGTATTVMIDHGGHVSNEYFDMRGWSTSNAANATISVAPNGNASIINNTTYYALYSKAVQITFCYYNNQSTKITGYQYMSYLGRRGYENVTIPNVVTSSKGPKNEPYMYVSDTENGIEKVIPTTERNYYYAVYGGKKSDRAITLRYYSDNTEYIYAKNFVSYHGVSLNTSNGNLLFDCEEVVNKNLPYGYTFRGICYPSHNGGNMGDNPIIAYPGELLQVPDSEYYWGVPAGNYTYYATYQKTIYIVYDLKGGTGNIPNTPVTVYMNCVGTKTYVKASVTTSVPTKAGYIFNGWWKDSSCSSVKVGTEVLPNNDSNLILYAGWKSANTYSLLSLNNETTSKSVLQLEK